MSQPDEAPISGDLPYARLEQLLSDTVAGVADVLLQVRATQDTLSRLEEELAGVRARDALVESLAETQQGTVDEVARLADALAGLPELQDEVRALARVVEVVDERVAASQEGPSDGLTDMLRSAFTLHTEDLEDLVQAAESRITGKVGSHVDEAVYALAQVLLDRSTSSVPPAPDEPAGPATAGTAGTAGTEPGGELADLWGPPARATWTGPLVSDEGVPDYEMTDYEVPDYDAPRAAAPGTGLPDYAPAAAGSAAEPSDAAESGLAESGPGELAEPDLAESGLADLPESGQPLVPDLELPDLDAVDLDLELELPDRDDPAAREPEPATGPAAAPAVPVTTAVRSVPVGGQALRPRPKRRGLFGNRG